MINSLIGKWIASPTDIDATRDYGNTTLQFTKNGDLIYTIHEDQKKKKILLKYHVQDKVLITDQPSKPREERTNFGFSPTGELLLSYGGKTSRYVRVEEGPNVDRANG